MIADIHGDRAAKEKLPDKSLPRLTSARLDRLMAADIAAEKKRASPGTPTRTK